MSDGVGATCELRQVRSRRALLSDGARYTHEECSTASGYVSASVIHGTRRDGSAYVGQIHTKWVCLWTCNNAGLEPYTMLDMSSLLGRDKNESTKTLRSRSFCRTPCTVKHNTVAHRSDGVHVVVAYRDGGRAYSTNGGRQDCLVRTRTNRHSAILIIEALRLKLF